MLEKGYYEQVISQSIDAQLAELDARDPGLVHVDRRAVDGAEAPRVLAQYVAALAERAFQQIAESTKPEGEALLRQCRLANDIANLAAAATGDQDFAA